MGNAISEEMNSSTQEIKNGWKPEIATAPLYMQVAHHLETRISNGDFVVGSLLPTENELAEALGVSRQTVRQAIGLLRTRGGYPHARVSVRVWRRSRPPAAARALSHIPVPNFSRSRRKRSS